MKTLTQEEFKKRYGDTGLQKMQPTEKTEIQKKPSYINRVKESVGTDIAGRVDRFGAITNRDTNLLDKSVQKFGQGAGLAANALETVVQEIPGVRKATEKIGEGINWLAGTDFIKAIGDKIGGNEKVQELVGLYDSDQSVKDSVDAFANVLRLGADIEGGITSSKTGVQLATKVVESIPDVVSPILSKVENSFKRVSSNPSVVTENFPQKIADFISRDTDGKTATILKETTEAEVDDYIKVAEKAATDPRMITPYEKVGDKMADATKELKKQADEAGKKKSEYLSPMRAGLDTFSSKTIVDDLVRLQNASPESSKKYIGDVLQKAKKVKTKGGADRFIDEIQSDLYNSNSQMIIPKGTTLDKQLRVVLEKFNTELKNSLPKGYAEQNTRFSNLTKVIGSMNRALGEVVDGVPVRGASLVKQFFSPSGRKAKEIFEYVKKNTGIDLAKDTTLARFSMELFDDPRAKAILEGLPTQTSGLLEKGLSVLVDKTGLGKGFQKALKDSEIRKAKRLTTK